MLILIGNKLSSSGLNATSIEKLAIDLDSRYRIESASDKKNNIFRIIDIISLIIINRKVCKLIVVDVFSTRAFYFSGMVMLLARFFNMTMSLYRKLVISNNCLQYMIVVITF